jgi:hypothetical protein
MPASPDFSRHARYAGFFYLALAVFGGMAFLWIRPQLFVENGGQALMPRHANLMRLGIALELATALSQALAAVWFGRLFRGAHEFAANSITHFGMVNAIAILCSSALMLTSLQVAHAPVDPDPALGHLLFKISSNFWQAGNLFFGLWLIPMGVLVWRSSLGPRILGWILIVGGVGYVLNMLLIVSMPNVPATLIVLLPIAATVGEIWMIVLLLWTGFREPRAASLVSPREGP